MNDEIRIRGLEVQTRVGVTPHERARAQTVVVDVDVTADLTRAAATDELAETIDYAALVTKVADSIAASETRLLEHLAGKVISVVSRMDGVEGVTVQISKRPPPVAEKVEAIAVRIVGSGT
ncbi:dihydroneopterin aldolase [soil metagenome]